MGLVDDHAVVEARLEELAGVGTPGDETRGDDADSAGGTSGPLMPDGRILDAPLIDPLATIPDGRGHVEQVGHLGLPLPDERLGCEDQDRPTAYQGDELRHHRQLDGLAQPDLIGQDESGLLVGADVGVEGHLDERLLMLPEPGLLAVHRRLDQGRGRVDRFALAGPSPVLDRMDYAAAGQPTNVFDDEIGQGHGRWATPRASNSS